MLNEARVSEMPSLWGQAPEARTLSTWDLETRISLYHFCLRTDQVLKPVPVDEVLRWVPLPTFNTTPHTEQPPTCT